MQELHVKHVRRKDKDPLELWEIHKLGSLNNDCATILRGERTFFDPMRVILNYSVSFELEFGLKFMDALLPYVFRDMKASKFMQVRGMGTFRRYARLARSFKNNPSIFEVVVQLAQGGR